MSSSKETVDYIIEQLGRGITVKAMFGEYAVYRNGLLIGLICDGQLFLKPTEAVRGLLEDLEEAPAYPGAKPSFLISGELWDDAELMAALAAATARELGQAAKKKPTTKRRPSRRRTAKR